MDADEHKNQMKSRSRRNDRLLLIVLVLLAAALLVWQGAKRREGRTATLSLLVTVANDEVLQAPLTADVSRLRDGAEVSLKAEEQAVQVEFDETGFTVFTELGYNHFSVETDTSGKAGIRCDAADCPDLVCVDTGLIRMENELIVCLPHRVSLRLVRTDSGA